jgi:hypothetical protein
MAWQTPLHMLYLCTSVCTSACFHLAGWGGGGDGDGGSGGSGGSSGGGGTESDASSDNTIWYAQARD